MLATLRVVTARQQTPNLDLFALSLSRWDEISDLLVICFPIGLQQRSLESEQFLVDH